MIYQLNIRGLGDNFKSIYESRLNSLMDRAPSDACACSSIIKNGKKYLGVLDIFSSQGNFMAKSVELDPDNLIQSLFVQMQTQFKEWREVRGLAEAN
jgi:hypothetical protein